MITNRLTNRLFDSVVMLGLVAAVVVGGGGFLFGLSMLDTVPQPLSAWRVELVSPMGEIMETWTVRCKAKPIARYDSTGGRLDAPAESHRWESQINAPVGWSLIVKGPYRYE